MTRLDIEIPTELKQVLVMVAEKLHEQEDNIVVKALKSYLQEAQEDIEDAEIALERLNNPNTKYYTPEETREWINKNCPKEKIDLEQELDFDRISTFYSLHNSLVEWESEEDERAYNDL
jgi:hypothetical protein